MSDLPEPLELYYRVCQGRPGLGELRRVVAREGLRINASLEGLPPALFFAAISYDEEIFQLLLDHGADLEMTAARAERIPLPTMPFSMMGALKRVAFAAMAIFGLRVPGLHQFVRQPTGVARDPLRMITDAWNLRSKQVQWIEARKEELAKNYPGQAEHLTPFAGAVIRGGKMGISRLLKHNPNPDPDIGGMRLTAWLERENRTGQAEELLTAAIAYSGGLGGAAGSASATAAPKSSGASDAPGSALESDVCPKADTVDMQETTAPAG